jgi:hypothetical protein
METQIRLRGEITKKVKRTKKRTENEVAHDGKAQQEK